MTQEAPKRDSDFLNRWLIKGGIIAAILLGLGYVAQQNGLMSGSAHDNAPAPATGNSDAHQ